MRKLIYISFLLALLFISCINDDITDCPIDRVEISFSLTDFVFHNNSATRSSTRATEPGTTAENTVSNLYVFLFNNDPAQTIKYYIAAATFTDGTWTTSTTENVVRINKTQTQVGTRDVYIVANCADIQTQLAAVNSANELQTVLRTTSAPSITTPLLMEGHLTHNFVDNYQLKTIPLTRAVAKLELTVNLDPTHQSAVAADYGYKYLNFGTETWVLPKADQQTTDKVASHTAWQPISGITNGTIPTTFTLTTYINEYKNTTEPTPVVEFKLPYNDGGFLPPPEFGDGDIYRLPLPLEAVRNTWYKYTLDLVK